MMKRIFCLVGFLLLAMPAVAENVYKWTDEDGETHYSKTPPPKTAGYEVQRLNRQALVLESIKPYQPQNQANDQSSAIARTTPASKDSTNSNGRTARAAAGDNNTETIEQRSLRDNLEAQENELVVAQRSREGQVQALIDQVGLAAGRQRAGQPVPADISQAISQLQQSVRQQDGVIRHMEQQISTLRASLDMTDPMAQEGRKGTAGGIDDAGTSAS